MKRKEVLRTGYKIAGVLLVLYALVVGMTITLPDLKPLMQSSRNIFFHVPMWFATITLMSISLYHSVRLLRLLDPDLDAAEYPLISDVKAEEAARIGVIFNGLGLLTGIVWSRVAWAEDRPGNEFSTWWAWDPIQVCALIALLIYLAYFLLRSSFAEPVQRARISAVYNIFAFAALIPLYFIIPRMFEGLHPTAGKGSFIFDRSQISNEFRIILYPGMIGFILISVWIYELRSRLGLLRLRLEDRQALNYFNRQSNL
ncbi:MAG: ABC transporter permease [Bacteroidetes bacterium]|jgi:heme exporter protein C|nr:MAG: ABC transporter permease [Bacteroidota bacterium]